MAGFFGMFGKKNEQKGDSTEAPKVTAPPPPPGARPPVPRPPGVGGAAEATEFPSVMGLRSPKSNTAATAKSTQRIVLPGQQAGAPIEATMRIVMPGKRPPAAPAKSAPSAAPMASSLPGEKFNLPVGMVLRLLPQEILVPNLADLINQEDEFSMPLDLVLPQLQSGKIEFTVEELIPHLPSKIFKPAAEIQTYLASTVNLPIMDVFTRIPPDKLTPRQEVASVAETPKAPMIPAVPAPIIRPAAPIIPPPSPAEREAVAVGKTISIEPPASSVRPLSPPPSSVPADSLAALLAAAQSSMGDSEDEKTMIVPPPSIEMDLVQEPVVTPPPAAAAPAPAPLIPPPPIKIIPPPPSAPVPPSAVPADSLAALLAAAQSAIGDEPQSEMTIMVPQLQEDAVPPPEQEKAPVVVPPPVVPKAPKLEVVPESPKPLIDLTVMESKPPVAPPVEPPATPVVEEPATPKLEVPKPPPVAMEAPVVAPVVIEPAPVVTPEEPLDLNGCTAEQLKKSVACSDLLAEAIIVFRQALGGFAALEDLIKVPGMTAKVYTQLTGQVAPAGTVVSINALLGIPAEFEVTLAQAVARLRMWPGVQGCLIARKNGTVLEGSLPSEVNTTKAVTAASEILEAVSKLSWTGGGVDELILPSLKGTWYAARRGDLLLLVLNQGQQIPAEQTEILRKLLIELNERA